MAGNRYLPTNFYQEQPSEAFSPLPITPYHARAVERFDVSFADNPERITSSPDRKQFLPSFAVKRGTVAALAAGMACIVAYAAARTDLTSSWLAVRDAWPDLAKSFDLEMFRGPRPRNDRTTLLPPRELLTEITSIPSLTSPTAAYRDAKGASVFGRGPNPPCGPDVVFGVASIPAICDSGSWEVIGTTGQLGILLPHPSRLDTVTVQVQRGTALPKCAPRDLVLWGLVGRQKDLATLRRDHRSVDRAFAALPGTVAFPTHENHQVLVPLAVFRFNAHSENLTQTFMVEPLWDADKKEAMLGFGVAILQILTNWGSSLTCIHRLYFHGRGL